MLVWNRVLLRSVFVHVLSFLALPCLALSIRAPPRLVLSSVLADGIRLRSFPFPYTLLPPLPSP